MISNKFPNHKDGEKVYQANEVSVDTAYSRGYKDFLKGSINRWPYGHPVNQYYYKMGWEDGQADKEARLYSTVHQPYNV